MSKALTPKAKGTGVGREVLQQGPMIMSPGGGFHPIPDMGGNDEVHAEGTEHEAFAFPLDNPGGGTNATAGASGTAGASFASRKLFGGAITMTLPTNFDDVSAIRDVPDHQEVFVDRNSEMSLIVEILDMEEEISDEAAAQHFFKDLAQFNESTNVTVESMGVITDPRFMPLMKPTYPRCALIGRQAVQKFAKSETTDPDAVMDLVDIYLVALRLPVVQTDILITLNAPHGKILSRTDVSADPGRGHVSVQMLLPRDPSVAEMDVCTTLDPFALQIMQQALESFNIVDWALFA